MPVTTVNNEQIRKSEQPKLADDIKAFKIAQALKEMKTKIYTVEDSIKIFGRGGVGGITSEKACASIDRDGVRVWLSDALYISLRRKAIEKHGPQPVSGLLDPYKNDVMGQLRHPDELSKVEMFKEHVPIFKALSSCNLSIIDVVSTSPEKIAEMGKKLRIENDIASELPRGRFYLVSKLEKKYGRELVEETLIRYFGVKMTSVQPPVEKPVAGTAPLQDKALELERELRGCLTQMVRWEVSKALDAPDGRKVNVAGYRKAGVEDEDKLIRIGAITDGNAIVIQLDGDEAKVFVRSDAYSEIKGKFIKEGATAQDICSRISKEPESLGDKFRNFSSIFKALLESNIRVVELKELSKRELREKDDLLMTQHWAVLRVLNAKNVHTPLQTILDEICEAFGNDPQKVYAAFGRYGVEDRVEGPILPKKAEVEGKPKPPKHEVVLEPDAHLMKKISKLLQLMEKRMVDEKVDGMEFAGFRGIKTIKIHEDVVIKVKKGTASLMMKKDFHDALCSYAKSRKEFQTLKGDSHVDEDQLLINYPQLLEGGHAFAESRAEFRSAIKVLKEMEIESFVFKPTEHSLDAYVIGTRKECVIPVQFMQEFSKEKNIGKAVSNMLQWITPQKLIESLENAGMVEEARHVKTTRGPTVDVNKLIKGWAESGVVPSKEEFLKCAEKLHMSQEEFKGALESGISEMRDENEKGRGSIKERRQKLMEEMYAGDAAQKGLNELIRDDTKSIEENEKRIKKAEEALRVLKGE